MLAAGRARYVVLVDEIGHLLLRKCIDRLWQLNALLLTVILDQLVCTETLMALLTVHQRICKSAKMSGCHPGLRIHQNRTVDADIVRILCDEFLPPRFFYIILQLYAQVSIVPCICKATVNLRARIHKSSSLCKCHNFVHSLFHTDPPQTRFTGIHPALYL